MMRRNSFGPVLVFAAVSWCLDAWFSPHAARDLALVATEEPQLVGQIKCLGQVATLTSNRLNFASI